MKKTTKPTKEPRVFPQIKPTKVVENVSKEHFVEAPVWQFYFKLSSVSIYDTPKKQEIGKFTVLAVHHVPSDCRTKIASKHLVCAKESIGSIFLKIT